MSGERARVVAACPHLERRRDTEPAGTRSSTSVTTPMPRRASRCSETSSPELYTLPRTRWTTHARRGPPAEQVCRALVAIRRPSVVQSLHGPEDVRPVATACSRRLSGHCFPRKRSGRGREATTMSHSWIPSRGSRGNDRWGAAGRWSAVNSHPTASPSRSQSAPSFRSSQRCAGPKVVSPRYTAEK